MKFIMWRSIVIDAITAYSGTCYLQRWGRASDIQRRNPSIEHAQGFVRH